MAKCWVDKYWNKIILSYLECLPTAYLGRENNWKQNADTKGPLNGYFLQANKKTHDAQILIWIIKHIFTLLYR